MAKLIERHGGPARALASGFAGLIGAVGLAVAVVMSSCEAGSRTDRASTSSGHAPARTANTSVARAPLPRLDPTTERQVARADEPQMRVRIMGAVDGLKVACHGGAGGVLIGQGDPRGSTTLAPGSKTDKRIGVSVQLKGGTWLVTETAGALGGGPSGATVATYPASHSLVLMPEGIGQMLIVNGTVYPGVVRLSPRSDVREGAFDVVDFVSIEDYLPGVVAKEMLNGWPLGAYQAQAVAARTYALHEKQRCAAMPFDVEATDRDQVYGGATGNTVAREAVRSTRGVVLMDGNNLLRAYFSSTCGGRTAAAHDTWPTGPGFEFNLAPPIQEHHREFACQGSPLFRWQVERPRWELAQRLRWYGERNGMAIRKIRDVRAIEIASVNGDGRPNKYKIVEPGGAWYQLSAEELRLACNTNANGSQITLGPEDAPPLLDAVASVGAGAPLLGFEAPEMSAPAAPAVTVPDITRATRVSSSDFEVVVRGDRVTITGRGFGHGVGLCQYCAKGFAEHGEDWRTMLARFYPGARIVSMY